MTERVRILLIDDHTLFRESLLRLLDGEPGLEVVGHCAAVAEALKIISETAVDVVLLDYDLGSEVGTDLLRPLHHTRSSVRVLLLTAGMVASATLNAMDAAAAGVVLKHSGTRQLLEAIKRVAAGEAWWDTGIVRPALAAAQGNSVLREETRELTDRQRIVLRCILDGLSNKEIAARIQYTEASVKSSIQELFSKAGVRTRSQLVRVAIERFSSEWLRDKQ